MGGLSLLEWGVLDVKMFRMLVEVCFHSQWWNPSEVVRHRFDVGSVFKPYLEACSYNLLKLNSVHFLRDKRVYQSIILSFLFNRTPKALPDTQSLKVLFGEHSSSDPILVWWSNLGYGSCIIPTKKL